jgi:hypothetical protein
MSMSRTEAAKLLESARDPALRKVLSRASGAILEASGGQERASDTISHEDRTQTQISNPESKQQPAALAGKGSGEAPGTERPHVCFTLRRVRLLDVDGKYSSIKDALDALCYSGALPGDREDQITLEVRQEKVKSFKDEETIITIDIP